MALQDELAAESNSACLLVRPCIWRLWRNGSGPHLLLRKMKSVYCVSVGWKLRAEEWLLITVEQWYSNWGTCTLGGTRRHLRGYVKLTKINILFHDKHWIIRARFRVSHKRPDVRTCDLGASFLSLSLSLLYAILIWAASFILSHTVHIILLC
jgi:hypothetical protein